MNMPIYVNEISITIFEKKPFIW